MISTPSASAALDDEARSIRGARVVAVTIQPSLGVDPLVDYPSLIRIGPWDDRNYQLTAADLALLSPTEDQLTIPIPAFYRVELRKAYPNLMKTGPAQYPHSVRHFYFLEHGSYRISGVDYYQSEKTENGFVILDDGSPVSTAARTDRVVATPPFAESDDVRVTPNGHFAESAIKFDPVNRQRAVAGAIEFTSTNIPSQAMFWSRNGGATWSRSAALPLGGTCCDPTVDWSSDGVHAYAATLGNYVPGGQVWFYRSADGGQTWTDLATATPGDPRREITTGTLSDKEFLHVDKSPVSPWKDNLYLTWHDANVLKFSRSTDRGNTWSVPISISDSITSGIGSDISTDRQGNIYYFWASLGRAIWVRKSTDGGQTFSPRVRVATTNASFTFRLPPMQIRAVFVNAASDADTSTGLFSNRIYVAWSDSSAFPVPASFNNHGQVKVAFSSDGGSTWGVRIPHETADVLNVDRFHPWIGVGTNGIVHAMFYDNRRHNGREGVDVFHSKSSDGGDTWSAPARLTEEISFPADLGFQLGDYNGLDVAGTKPWGIFTDNRDETCVTASPSIDVYAVTPSTTNTACSWAGGRFVCQGCTTQTLYSSNFDGLSGALAGWSRGSFLAGGTVGWQGVRPCGGTSGFESFRYSAAGSTGTNCTPNYFANEHAYAYPNSAASSGLGIVVPAFAANTKLYFRHQRDFDIDRDGGLISVSVDGVNFVPAPITAYRTCIPNSVASSSCSPPGTAGLPIWSGTTFNFLNASIDLDSACNLASGGTTGCAGKNVRIAFTAISDCGVELGGWNVDDVSVTACLP